MTRMATIPKPTMEMSALAEIDLRLRVKDLELRLGDQQQMIDGLNARLSRAEQKIVKLKTKSKKKRGELWAGLDHVANFINALDTQGMSAKRVRSVIYAECTTPTEGKYEDD